MNSNDGTTPDAAMRYFDASIPGQLFSLMAEALAPAARPVRPGDAESRPRTRRGAAFGHGILHRLDRWFWRQEQKARDAYLAQSHDIFELERRIAALERGTISRYY